MVLLLVLSMGFLPASFAKDKDKEVLSCGVVMNDGQGADVDVVDYSKELLKGCPKRITISNTAKGLHNKKYKLLKGGKDISVELSQPTSLGPCFYKLDTREVTCQRGLFQ